MAAAADWRNETAADVAWENWEADERRGALRAGVGTCYRHDMRPDGHGGGVCQCGETVTADEL